MGHLRALVGLVVCVLVSASSLRANLVVDQEQIPPLPPTFNFGCWNMNAVPQVLDAAQTFTVGVNGTLEQVDLMVQNKFTTQPLTVRILGTSTGGLPDSTQVLATMTVPASSIPSFNSPITFDSFVFPQSQWLNVHPGEVLAIELSENTFGSGNYVWWGNDSATYPGGGTYEDDNNQNLWQLSFSSYAEQSGFITWVDTPEPSMILPITLAGLLVRRRRLSRAE